MSDYLGHLLSRSFAPTAGVRPIVASVFEPVSPATSLERPHEINSPTESPEESPVAFLSRPRSPVIPTEPAEFSERVVPAHRPRLATATDSVAPAPLRPRPTAAVDPTTPLEIAVSSTLSFPAPALHFPASVPFDVPREAAEPAPSSRAPALNPVVPSASAVVRDRPVRTALTSSRRETHPPSAPVATSAAPTIQVTIGRVEIRATTPPATVRAKAKKEPELSLDAYLQRRAEGGRR